MSPTLGATAGYPHRYRSVVFRVVSLLIAGSIATDHLMSFQGRFSDSLVVDQLDKLSVSFLVDDLDVRRGGCAANIAFGLGNLGLEPVLVGAVGEDFGDYRAWLERHRVDCGSVHVSETRHTARFVCTTDSADPDSGESAFTADEDDEEKAGCGCSSAGHPGSLAILFAFLLPWYRRRW